MLRLIVADDERVIRETLSRLIDWESLGVELIGVCKDGIEVYNMILDESPDIVMTDIRMPGLSGLEVVREIAAANRQIQFIFLSGYEEFDYAREAMKYGVKYYLLKPCSEQKVKEAICQAREDCLREKKLAEERMRQNRMLGTIRQDAMYHLIMEGIAGEHTEEQLDFYGQYIDFFGGPCYLYYVYYVELDKLEEILKSLEERQRETAAVFYGVYVKNTLLLMSGEGGQTELLETCLEKACPMAETEEKPFKNLRELLKKLIQDVSRFETVYAIHHYKAIAISNNQGMIRYMKHIYEQIGNAEEEQDKGRMDELLAIAEETTQTEALQVLANGFCTRMLSIGVCTVAEAADFLRAVNQENTPERLQSLTSAMIRKVRDKLWSKDPKYSIVTERIMGYVEEHLPERDLTLKKISEEYLYMNVDYVSRRFRKDTGKKFSQYLTEQRVKKAKELLSNEESSKIQYVAERVGCGNNPQYFTQIFKKLEGTTPGKWAAQMKK